MVHDAYVRWVIFIAFFPLFAYGLLNVFMPRTTLAWQVRSTARHDQQDFRSSVGRAFQGWLGISPNDAPGRAVLNRIRAIGLVEVAVATAVVAVVFYASS
jgi:hypothetical protein